MSGEEAKNTLDAVGGLLVLIEATCLPAGDSGQFKRLFDDYHKAVEVAKDAINIMDNRLDIEGKGDSERNKKLGVK